MKPSFAKIVIRIVGTLAGLLGLDMLCFIPSTVSRWIAEPNLSFMAFDLIFTAMGVYLVYAAYLVWFRFSPTAVRHVCGLLGFLIIMFLPRKIHPLNDAEFLWSSFEFLGSLGIVYFVYRFATDRLNRSLFPDRYSKAIT